MFNRMLKESGLVFTWVCFLGTHLIWNYAFSENPLPFLATCSFSSEFSSPLARCFCERPAEGWGMSSYITSLRPLVLIVHFCE